MRRITAIITALICLTAFISVPVTASEKDFFEVNLIPSDTQVAEQPVTLLIKESKSEIKSIIVYAENDVIYQKYENISKDSNNSYSIEENIIGTCFKLDITKNGKYKFVVEKTNGEQAYQEREITTIDETAPVINEDLTSPSEWVNEHTFAINPVDAGTGIKEIVVNKGGKEICKAVSEENGKFKLTCAEDGIFTQSNNGFRLTVKENGDYEFIATDKAGNQAKKEIKIDEIDSEAPSELKVSGSPSEWVSKHPYTITAADSESGIKEVAVYEDVYNTNSEVFKPAELDKGNTYKYESTKGGTHRIVATDNAGNFKETFIEAKFIDSEAPELTVEKDEWIYDCTFNISASDSASGLKEITVNDEKIEGSSYFVNKSGTYKFVATDNAGNSKEEIHKFGLNKIKVALDNEFIDFDVPPIIEDGRTLVPLRAIFEALGAKIDWNGDTQTVTATKNEINITLKIGTNELKVNETIKALDVPAKIIDGRTLVPARAISESFGCNVIWDSKAQTVVIFSKEGKMYIGERDANGNPSGQGTLYYNTAAKTGNDSGKWNGNTLEDGTSNVSFENGDKYAGNIVNGEKTFGRYTYSNGDYYEGYFLNNKKHGEGAYYYAELGGDPIKGVWENGQQIEYR